MPYDASSRPTLNVIVHGSAALVQDKQNSRILVLMPDLGYHVYRAGSWLAETDIARGTYTLKGVPDVPAGSRSDDQWLDPKRNIILSGHADIKEKLVFATLILPLPKKITSLRLAEIPTALFSDADDLLEPREKIQNMATLQVFTYDIQDENGLALTTDEPGGNDVKGHYWEPVFIGNCVNLHVFSSEDHYHRPSNAKDDFNVCVEILGGDLTLKTGSQPAGEIPVGDTPDGVTDAETEGLPHRTLRMARLGNLIRQNGDANLAWYGNDALDDDPRACGFCGIDL